MKRIYVELKNFNDMFNEYKNIQDKNAKLKWIDYKIETYAIYLCYVFDFDLNLDGKREFSIGPFSEEPKTNEEIMRILDNYLSNK